MFWDRWLKNSKRPPIHLAMIGLCATLLVALFPDQLVGLVAHGRTIHWVKNDISFNAFTFAFMFWHVMPWAPLNALLIYWIWKQKHKARRLGFFLFGAEASITFFRLAFIQYLLYFNAWPDDFGTSALWSSGFWFCILAANLVMLAYFWAEGHTFNR